MQPYEIALALAIILLIIELLTGTFVIVCFSPALLVVAGVEYIFHGFSFWRDFFVFVVVVVLSSLVVRLLFKTKSSSKNEDKDINEY